MDANSEITHLETAETFIATKGAQRHFLGWLRDKSPPQSRNIPVIVVSSTCSTREIECARALGATHFAKPLRWTDLLRAVDQHVAFSGVPNRKTRDKEA